MLHTRLEKHTLIRIVDAFVIRITRFLVPLFSLFYLARMLRIITTLVFNTAHPLIFVRRISVAKVAVR